MELEDERKVIALMNESLRDQEEMISEQRRESENMVKEINDLLKSKRKISEDYRLSEEEFKSQFVHFTEEIQFLKGQALRATSEKDFQSKKSNNLRSNSNESNS
jgi:chromosome segregation ATPase